MGDADGLLPGRIHRILGRDRNSWQTGLQAHTRVTYRGVYPGIDVLYYGNGGELEYDLVVSPGSRLEDVRLRFDGARDVSLDDQGNLRLDLGSGVLMQRRPVAYQVGSTGREPVSADFRRHTDGTVGFEVGEHDADRVLVIDPVLSYATFLGGAGLDRCWDVAVDATGAAYVVGETDSPSFPTLNLISTNGAFPVLQGGLSGIGGDAFVAKIVPDGTAVEWFTYLGGTDLDAAFSIALGPGGEPVLGGYTTSQNFPLTTNALQTAVRGETNRFTGRKPLEGFLTRLSADGSRILASTLLGGDGEDQVLDVAVAGDGRMVAVGSTSSTNFPVTTPAFQGALGGGTDGFVAQVSADAGSLISGTFLGGTSRDSAEGVVLDGAGVAHLVGITGSIDLPVVSPLQSTNAGLYDAFAAGIRLADNSAAYVTYLGGGGDDFAYRNALDPSGDIWAVGETASMDFPVVASLQSTNAGFSDGFVVRWTADGSSLSRSTYLGGESADALWAARVDADGNLHLAGESFSQAFPGVSTNLLQAANAGSGDLVVGRLGVDGVLTSTYYGSSGTDRAYGIDVDPAGGAYIVGQTFSGAFPLSGTNVAQTLHAGGSADGFVLKLAREPALQAALSNEAFEVSWAAPNPGFSLETADSVGPGRGWSAVEGTVDVRAGRHVVRLPVSATNCVFRLRWSR